MTARGRFITFEGGEGAGKSTQAKLLQEKLISRGGDVVLTREPGGSKGAEEIRALVVDGTADRWTPLTETLLFIAARTDHVARVIRPALDAGKFVLCDRFANSTFVYQGVGRGLGVDTVRALQEAALGDFAPDLTFVFDLDPAEGLKRAGARGGADRFEKFDPEFHRTLRAAFRDLATRESHRCVLVNAARPPATIAADVWSTVEARFG